MIQVYKINLKPEVGHFIGAPVVVHGSWLEESIGLTTILCHKYLYLISKGSSRGFEYVRYHSRYVRWLSKYTS